MKVNVVVDAGVEGRLEEWKKRATPRVGLIIGQVKEWTRYVLMVVPTPNQEEDKEGIRDPEWIGAHAAQVEKMLVGGVDILGVFEQSNETQESKLIVEALGAIAALLRKRKRKEGERELMLLHFHIRTSKETWKSFSWTDLGSVNSGRPAQSRISKLLNRFQRLQSRVALDITCSLDGRTNTHLRSKLSSVIEEWGCLVSKNVKAFIDGKFIGEGKEECGKWLGQDSKDNLVDVQLLVPAEYHPWLERETEEHDQGTVYRFRATLSVFALLHEKLPLLDGIQFLLDDGMRSCDARLEIVLGDDEEPQFQGEALFLPQRVMMHVQGNPQLQWVEYMLGGEKVEECLERSSQLAGEAMEGEEVVEEEHKSSVSVSAEENKASSQPQVQLPSPFLAMWQPVVACVVLLLLALVLQPLVNPTPRIHTW